MLGQNCADCRREELIQAPVKGEQADAMSVADYGPSSQTLTFLDPEDDLGSLGIGADTQVDVTSKSVSLSLCRLLSVSLSQTGRWLRLSLHLAKPVPTSGGIPQVNYLQYKSSYKYLRIFWTGQIFENILDRSKLVIHEADEPPLGVPGELHFDDEEEEVERGGLGFKLQNIVLILKY